MYKLIGCPYPCFDGLFKFDRHYFGSEGTSLWKLIKYAIAVANLPLVYFIMNHVIFTGNAIKSFIILTTINIFSD